MSKKEEEVEIHITMVQSEFFSVASEARNTIDMASVGYFQIQLPSLKNEIINCMCSGEQNQGGTKAPHYHSSK